MPSAGDTGDFWRSSFDRVTVIRHTAYNSSRGESLERELGRVGLLGFAEYRWTFPSPFLAVLSNAVRLDRSVRCIGHVDAMLFGFYSEVKTALALGASRVLILEDDVRFVNDVGLVKKAVVGLPDDFDEAHLAWLQTRGTRLSVDSILSLPRVGGSWVEAGDLIKVRDSSATAFSRSGMERFVRVVESALEPAGHRGLVPCDETDYDDLLRDNGKHTLLAIPMLARQALFSGRMSRRNFINEYAPFCADADVASFGGGGVK